jgi:hypothetical protein
VACACVCSPFVPLPWLLERGFRNRSRVVGAGRNPLCKTLSGTILGIANFIFLVRCQRGRVLSPPSTCPHSHTHHRTPSNTLPRLVALFLAGRLWAW